MRGAAGLCLRAGRYVLALYKKSRSPSGLLTSSFVPSADRVTHAPHLSDKNERKIGEHLTCSQIRWG